MKLIATICICALTTAHAQKKVKPVVPPAASSESEYVEVTKHDFVALPKITSTHLLSFGVRLGMSRDESLQALQGFTSQVVARPGQDGDEDIFAGSEVVMSLHFDPDQSRVNKIEWLPPMGKFLPGRSHDLLTAAAFDQDSSVRLELLGREDNATHEQDRRLEMNTQTFVYGKEGLQLELDVVDLSAIHKTITVMKIILVTPARAR